MPAPTTSTTVQAREALAEILAAQGDLDAVRSIQEALARSRERRLGAEHPETLSIQLRLATTLGEQGELEAARRLQQHVVTLHERIHGMDDYRNAAQQKAAGGHLVEPGQCGRRAQAGRNRARGQRPAAHHGRHGVRAARIRPGRRRHARPAILDARGGSGDPDTLDHKLQQLQQLIDNQSPSEARELADSLRKMVLRAERRQSVAAARGGDDPAGRTRRTATPMRWWRSCKTHVSSLEGALIEAVGARSVAAQ